MGCKLIKLLIVQRNIKIVGLDLIHVISNSVRRTDSAGKLASLIL